MIEIQAPLFPIGQLVATPSALSALEVANQSPLEFLARHIKGDWGDLSEDDRQLNDDAVKDGSRILSAYILKTGEKIWVISEAADDQGNRAATTILLPSDY